MARPKPQENLPKLHTQYGMRIAEYARANESLDNCEVQYHIFKQWMDCDGKTACRVLEQECYRRLSSNNPDTGILYSTLMLWLTYWKGMAEEEERNA